MSLYSMSDWRAAGSFDAEPGQEITGEVYNAMRDCIPPRSMPRETARAAMDKYRIPVHEGFLMGEAHSTDENGRPLYLAFAMNEYGREKRYYYIGLSAPYKPLHGKYYYFDCMNAFVNDGLFPAAEFTSDAEAISKAADYEATLYKYEYSHGDRISTETLYEPLFA